MPGDRLGRMDPVSTIWTLRRSPTDTKVAGLCGGIARYAGVDPVLIRVGCALLALSGGVGLVLYLAGWLLIPLEGKQDAPIHDLLGQQARKWSREVWVVLVVTACLVTFAILGSLTPFGFGPAVILALLWYFGYYKNRPRPGGDAQSALPSPLTGGSAPSSPGTTWSGDPAATMATTPPSSYELFSSPGPATAFTEAADAWRQRVEEVTRPAASPTLDAFLAAPDPVQLYPDAPATGSSALPVTLSRSRSTSARRLRLLCLATLVLVLGGLGAADAVGGASISSAVYFSAALLVLGVTLVAAAWYGRARGLLPVALLLLLATITTSFGPVAHHGDWMPKPIVYTSADQLDHPDNREVGRLTVDLSRVPLKSDASYTAHVEMGHLQVTVPQTANVVVHWKVKSGALVMDPQDVQGGSDLDGTVTASGNDPQGPTLTLNLSVDRGVVEVDR